VGDGDATGSGRPGFVTSEAFGIGVGSGSWKTYRTGAVTVRPISFVVSQPIKLIAVSKIAQPKGFIEGLYKLVSLSATDIRN
jgi:hypothetical protein